MPAKALSIVFGSQVSDDKALLGLPSPIPTRLSLSSADASLPRTRESAAIALQDVISVARELQPAPNRGPNVAKHDLNFAIPSDFSEILSFYLFATGLVLLRLNAFDYERVARVDVKAPLQAELLGTLTALQDNGLLGIDGEIAFSKAANRLLDRLVQNCWSAPSDGLREDGDVEMLDIDHQTAGSVVERLNTAVEQSFLPFVKLILGPHDMSRLEGNGSHGRWKGLIPPEIASGKTQLDWHAIAMEKLGRLFATQIYHIVEKYPSKPEMIDDLRACTASPLARRFLSDQFHRHLAKHMLHPGRSTVDILEMYMKTIETFQKIDASGILLQNAVTPIRTFLKSRDDAMRIVLNSLLQPAKDEDGQQRSSTDTFSATVAECMDAFADFGFKEYYETRDLRDPAWLPEPVDAASGYQAARNLDALAHLMSLKPPDDVMNELQNVLGERLLSQSSSNYEMEMRLLRTFKHRFEELKMQHCEIMLQDVISSQRLEGQIQQGDASLGATTGNGAPAGTFSATMLSHYYWPPLQEQTFTLPPVISAQMSTYDARFRSLKSHRRLAWSHGLGRVHVELELEDRTVDDYVTTWQAAVIYHFDSSSTSERPATRSVAVLCDALAMEEPLVRAALAFWVGKFVLREHPTDPDVYVVMERLQPAKHARLSSSPRSSPLPRGMSTPSRNVSTATATHAHLAAAQAQAASATTLKSAADLLEENANVYGNFVAGMLTNQGAMPAKRIHMMLKMVVPGGFPFSETELSHFLAGLEGEGRIERAGMVWRMKKK